VERDGGEHCALLAAEVLIDGPAQRREELVPFCALGWLEAAGEPVPVFLIQGQRPSLPEAAARRRRHAKHRELGCPGPEPALAAEAVELRGDRIQCIRGRLPGQIVTVRALRRNHPFRRPAS
jgi:hypothetical protein